MWTTSQRAVILTLLVGLLIFLAVRRLTHTEFIPDPQPVEGLRARELADRLDPNTASAEELAAIPNVGDKLAVTIVEYREKRLRDYPGQPAFREPKDLLRIRGVGVAKMEAMQPYLSFPTSPATKSATR